VNDAGYSLAELLVALTLLAVGVLGAAASVAPVARLIRWGGSESASATLAAARLEALRVAGCGALSGGVAAAGNGYRVTWTVSPRGALRQVTVVVESSAGATPRAEAYEAVLECRR
jgi:prepilin-type N-terminal cleavage/methylation domain-containing protein